jgi:hypothetical protein
VAERARVLALLEQDKRERAAAVHPASCVCWAARADARTACGIAWTGGAGARGPTQARDGGGGAQGGQR